jgi:hypothetical protein
MPFFRGYINVGQSGKFFVSIAEHRLERFVPLPNNSVRVDLHEAINHRFVQSAVFLFTLPESRFGQLLLGDIPAHGLVFEDHAVLAEKGMIGPLMPVHAAIRKDNPVDRACKRGLHIKPFYCPDRLFTVIFMDKRVE